FADTVVARDLDLRQTSIDTSICNPNGYKSKNGLNFTTYCGQNNPFNDALNFTTPSMADCMEHCSRYWGKGEGCFGVVWVEFNGACWLRNSTTGTKNLEQRSGHYSALLVDGQMRGYDRTCPEADASIHDLAGVEGLAYTVNCGKVISGFDTCFSGVPKPCWEYPYSAFWHAKTLEECLRICVDQQPLCKAVSWNPGLEMGFANCWPKTGFPDSRLSAPSSIQGIMHSATITRIDPIDRTCPSSKTYTSKETNKKFDIHCEQGNTGTNTSMIHSQNITSCMDSCAKSDQKCTGVVFDSTLNSGYNNCYLKNTTNTLSDQPSATCAALSGSGTPTSPGSNTTNESSNSLSSSKAWIAGPVIGGIAAISLIAFAVFWFRRRKCESAGVASVEKDGGSLGAYSAAPACSPGAYGGFCEAHSSAPMELGGRPHELNELPVTNKYAHSKEGAMELP
ncbi:hypothetical protein GQ44DRAFT_627414, partial [Phaeosphaeriaceae sp. PMI808]